jgi:hypothetical protein
MMMEEVRDSETKIPSNGSHDKYDPKTRPMIVFQGIKIITKQMVVSGRAPNSQRRMNHGPTQAKEMKQKNKRVKRWCDHIDGPGPRGI